MSFISLFHHERPLILLLAGVRHRLSLPVLLFIGEEALYVFVVVRVLRQLFVEDVLERERHFDGELAAVVGFVEHFFNGCHYYI
jgi:hypothetical protein